MTQRDFAADEAVCAAATTFEWAVGLADFDVVVGCQDRNQATLIWRFIDQSNPGWPECLADRKRLEEENKTLREQLAAYNRNAGTAYLTGFATGLDQTQYLLDELPFSCHDLNLWFARGYDCGSATRQENRWMDRANETKAALEKAVATIERQANTLRTLAEEKDAEIAKLRTLPTIHCRYCGVQAPHLSDCDRCGAKGLCNHCIFRENHSCEDATP